MKHTNPKQYQNRSAPACSQVLGPSRVPPGGAEPVPRRSGGAEGWRVAAPAPPGSAGRGAVLPGPWHGRRDPAAAPAPGRAAGELNLGAAPHGSAALLSLRTERSPRPRRRVPRRGEAEGGSADGEARGRAGLGVQVGLLAAALRRRRAGSETGVWQRLLEGPPCRDWPPARSHLGSRGAGGGRHV